MSFLSMQHITKSFGGNFANRNIDLSVDAGQVHALLGENGAGKTTLMNILYGIYRPDSGTITVAGEKVRIRSPRDAISLKIGMVHQHFMLVPTLTVSQNITLGLREKGYPFTDRKESDRKIRRLSDEFGLDVRPGDTVADLSVGARQRVEIVKILYHDARLLILDEPTAVLTPQEIDNFFDVIRRLRRDGRSVIIITHRIAEVMRIADRVTVLRDGRRAAALDIRETDSAKLSELMIGRKLETVARRQPDSAATPDAPDRLRIRGLRLKGDGKQRIEGISLSIRPGEILGLAGVDGNGQKELAELIVGIRKPDAGAIVLDGREIQGLGVRQRKRLGIAYIPDDRHRDGLIPDMDVTANLMLNGYDRPPFSLGRFLRSGACRAGAREKVAEYRIKTPAIGTAVRYLSGGNQQKLILARELQGTPALIVACQPTRGLDVGAEMFVSRLLLAQKERGAAVLLISADLEQILTLSDRINVMFAGRTGAALENDRNLDRSEIGRQMAGLSGGAP